MRKVLFIVNYREGVGGISGQVKLLYDKLDRRKYQSDIFNAKGSIIERIKKFIILANNGRYYDVFHIHGCSYWGGFFPIILGVIIGKILKKKIIITYHGGGADDFFVKHPRIIKAFFKNANEIIVLSGFLEIVFQKFGIKTKVIPNIIEFHSKFNINHKKIEPIFISTRALDPIYNIKNIIQAFSVVHKTYKNSILYIVGTGSQEKQLVNYVKSQNIKNILFIGKVDNNEIYSILTKASIAISAPKFDNMPVSILEAFNAGLLVISSNVGGIPHMIKHMKNGLLFEEGNIKQLSANMVYSIEHQDHTIEMIKEANKGLAIYSWEYNKNRIQRLYD